MTPIKQHPRIEYSTPMSRGQDITPINPRVTGGAAPITHSDPPVALSNNAAPVEQSHNPHRRKDGSVPAKEQEKQRTADAEFED